MRPFINRVRYAPEVASKPDRLQKDLANAKTLVTMLEEEAAVLRQTKATKKEYKNTSTESESGKTEEQPDVLMNSDGPDDSEDDPEPREKGSEAVERRIDKVMADLRDQGLVDINDEKAYDTMKVSFFPTLSNL